MSNRVIFPTVRSWLDACEWHPHDLVSADEPPHLLLGYCCAECDEALLVRLSDVKRGGGLTKEDREAMRTAAGRAQLPATWVPGCVIVRDEFDMEWGYADAEELDAAQAVRLAMVEDGAIIRHD